MNGKGQQFYLVLGGQVGGETRRKGDNVLVVSILMADEQPGYNVDAARASSVSH